MSEVHKEVLPPREGPNLSADVLPAKRSAATASKLDSLLILAAVLAFVFGWSPILGLPETGVAIVVTVALLWLLCEQLVPLDGFWGRSAGWLPALTKGDVVILLFALLSSTLVFLPLMVGCVAWGLLALRSATRDERVGPDGWFHRAAILTSFVAMMVAAETSNIEPAWLRLAMFAALSVLYGMVLGATTPRVAGRLPCPRRDPRHVVGYLLLAVWGLGGIAAFLNLLASLDLGIDVIGS